MTLWTPPLGKDTVMGILFATMTKTITKNNNNNRCAWWKRSTRRWQIAGHFSPIMSRHCLPCHPQRLLSYRSWFFIAFLSRSSTWSLGNLEVGETGGSSDLLVGGGAGGSPEIWWEPRDWLEEAREERRSGRCSGGLRLVWGEGGLVVVVVCQLCLSFWLAVVVLCHPCLSFWSFVSPTITSGAASVLDTWYLGWWYFYAKTE